MRGDYSPNLQPGHRSRQRRAERKKLSGLEFAQGGNCFPARHAQFIGSAPHIHIQTRAAHELIEQFGGNILMEF
jgi:hypothetical protein